MTSSEEDRANEILAKHCPEQADLRAKVEKRRAQAALLSDLDVKQVDLSMKLDAIYQHFPQTEDLTGLMKTLSERARKVGLEILKYDPRPEHFGNSIDYVADIPIRVDVRGGYHQLGLFFDGLAKMSRTVHVQNLDIEQETSSLENQILASFNLVTYRVLSDEEREQAM